MSDPFQLSRPKPINPASPRAPEWWVWTAGAVIVGLATVGLYRGINEARTGQVGLLPSAGGGIVAPVDAANVSALPKDDQWSALSGPKVLPPAAPKAIKPADSDDDSSAPDDQSAAAQATDTGADDVPTPVQKPATLKTPIKPVAPSPDEAPPPPPPDGQ